MGWLKQNTQTPGAKLRTVLAAFTQPAGDGDVVYLQRMGLDAPKTFGEKVEARLVRLGLARTV
ncbi:hypothetical protein D3C71_2009350 [compost metagenome]